jgi:hypothetical protein
MSISWSIINFYANWSSWFLFYLSWYMRFNHQLLFNFAHSYKLSHTCITSYLISPIWKSHSEMHLLVLFVTHISRFGSTRNKSQVFAKLRCVELVGQCWIICIIWHYPTNKTLLCKLNKSSPTVALGTLTNTKI